MPLWVAWEKDTDRMCPSSPRQTWSWNLNHTASQLYLKLQVNRGVYCEWWAKDFKSILSLPKIWNRCLNSSNNSIILSLYWLKSLFSPMACTLFTQRKLAVSSLESCVVSPTRTTSTWMHIWYDVVILCDKSFAALQHFVQIIQVLCTIHQKVKVLHPFWRLKF